MRSIDDIQDLRAYAENKRGDCLSPQYERSSTKYLWQCEQEHQWFASWNQVKSKQTWCPFCADRVRKTIGDMTKLASERGGQCLSDIYVNWKTKLHWRCADGHEWHATPNNISRGSWCPYCRTSIGEEKCRYVLESLLDLKFPSRRDVLGENKELDGYNEDTKIGFEFDGQQHYEVSVAFHGTKRSLEQQIKTDRWKDERCFELGIRLVRIPYWIAEDDTELVHYALDQFEVLSVDSVKTGVRFEKFYEGLSRMSRLRSLAESHGGRLISSVYRGTNIPLTWECKLGHRWETKPSHVKGGHWCPYCAGNDKLNILTMMKMASSWGGKCISSRYVNARTKLEWECEEEHRWRATPDYVRSGYWCPTCRGLYAKSRGTERHT